MKKILSLIIAVVLLTASVSAAQLPSFLTNVITNYSADYTVSFTFDSSESIAALLDEIEFSEEIENFVDIKSLLRTLLAYNGTMKLQADISDDYKKIEMALTSESAHIVDINPNLNVDVNAKTGLWINMDLTDAEAPVFDIIYSLPFLNKYLKLTADDMGAEIFSSQMDTVFNKEYIDTVQKAGAELFIKHSTLTGGGTKYTLTMDNDGLTSYMDELMKLVTSLVPDNNIAPIEFPSVKGWKLLGDKGIKCVYEVNGGKATKGDVTADISVDIKEIYKMITGIDWEYEADGLLDFTFKMTTNIFAINKTKVEFPELNDENTITLADFGRNYGTAVPEEDVIAYPNWAVREYCDDLPIINGEIYVPLRQTMESAFENSVSIDYKNGVVAMESEFFNGYSILECVIDSTNAYTDGKAHTVTAPILIDGTTYVSSSFLADMLGWHLAGSHYDLIDKVYYYSFHTGY